jgi:hypothetical protein
VFPARVSSRRRFGIQVPPHAVVDVDALIKDEDRTEDDEWGSYVPGQCPTIYETRGVLARRVLANPYFYNDKKERSEQSWKERRHYLGDKKIEQIETEYGTPSGRIELSSEISCQIKRLIVFFGQEAESVEDELHDKIIALTGMNDINRIHSRWVHLESGEALLDESLARSERKDGNIFFIMGPSGSGKTFLAATQASSYKVTQQRRTTIYMNVPDSRVPFNDGQAAAKLVDWIKKKLKHQVKTFDPEKKLNMHVSFVFDEAGSSALDGFFERKEGIVALYSLLEPLALGVRLIVCGTGLTGENLCSRSDVCKVRMNEWDQNDLKLAATKMIWRNFASTTERDLVVSDVVTSIFEYPVLAALATNSRSGWFVLEAVSERFRLKNSVQSTWKEFLGESTGYIVSNVVDKYVEHNVLGGLPSVHRRRVAAMVLDIVEQSKANSRVMTKPGPGDKWYAPTFEGPAANYRDCVFACISFNVNYTSTGAELFPGQTLSVSVSPSLAIVLFSLLGASSSVLATWRTLQRVTALYIFRRMVLQYYQDFKELEYSLKGPNEVWTQLDNHLSCMQLIHTKKCIPEPGARVRDTLYVPLVGNGTVWLNKDNSPFVDVVAPNIFGQTKKLENGKVTVHIAQELLKCGLLKPECLATFGAKDVSRAERGWIVTRGLCEIWNSSRTAKGSLLSATGKETISATRQPSRRDLSDAYPENMLSTAEEIDTSQYFGANRDTINKLRHPNELEKEITFLVAYNASDVHLQLNFKDQERVKGEKPETMTIYESDLDDGVFNPISGDSRFQKWQDLLSKLRKNVFIKFLPI